MLLSLHRLLRFAQSVDPHRRQTMASTKQSRHSCQKIQSTPQMYKGSLTYSKRRKRPYGMNLNQRIKIQAYRP